MIWPLAFDILKSKETKECTSTIQHNRKWTVHVNMFWVLRSFLFFHNLNVVAYLELITSYENEGWRWRDQLISTLHPFVSVSRPHIFWWGMVLKSLSVWPCRAIPIRVLLGSLYFANWTMWKVDCLWSLWYFSTL